MEIGMIKKMNVLKVLSAIVGLYGKKDIKEIPLLNGLINHIK